MASLFVCPSVRPELDVVCILRYSHFNCLSVVCLTVSVGWYLDLCLILLTTNDSRVASRSDGPTPRGERGGWMSQRSPSVTGCLSEERRLNSNHISHHLWEVREFTPPFSSANALSLPGPHTLLPQLDINHSFIT